MLLQVVMKISGAAAMKKRELNEAIRKSLHAAGALWHKRFRLLHFTMSAFSMYGYSRRSVGYNTRKKRYFGHTFPLVFSGKSRDLSATHRITVTTKRVTVAMATRALNFRSKNSQVNMRKEFTTVTPQEEAAITSHTQKTLVREINRSTRQTTRRVA